MRSLPLESTFLTVKLHALRPISKREKYFSPATGVKDCVIVQDTLSVIGAVPHEKWWLNTNGRPAGILMSMPLCGALPLTFNEVKTAKRVPVELDLHEVSSNACA